MDVQHLLPSLFQHISPEEIAQYSRYDVHVKDVRDYQQKGTIEPIVLPLHTSVEFFESDQNSHLYSENNEEFLEETQLLKKIKQVDSVLQPNFLARAEYDLLFGSCHTSTPFRYQTESRNLKKTFENFAFRQILKFSSKGHLRVNDEGKCFAPC